jgi:hypothetical protein
MNSARTCASISSRKLWNMSEFILGHEIDWRRNIILEFVGRASNLSLPLSLNYPRIYKIFIKARSGLFNNNALDL